MKHISVSRMVVVGAMSLSLIALGAQRSAAQCDAAGADAADVTNAHAAIAANCDCAGARNHGTYVRCAAHTSKATLVNQSCQGVVVSCEAQSTCGKGGTSSGCTSASPSGAFLDASF